MVCSFESSQNEFFEKPIGSQKPMPAPRASRFDSAIATSSSWVVCTTVFWTAGCDAGTKAEAPTKARARVTARTLCAEEGGVVEGCNGQCRVAGSR